MKYESIEVESSERKVLTICKGLPIKFVFVGGLRTRRKWMTSMVFKHRIKDTKKVNDEHGLKSRIKVKKKVNDVHG